jgi:hypothetical protein
MRIFENKNEIYEIKVIGIPNPGNPMEILGIPWKSQKSHENPGNPKSAVSPLRQPHNN